MRIARILSWGTTLFVLAAASVATAVPVEATGAAQCRVVNARTGVVSTELQAAVSVAAPGAVLKVRGVCGRFTASQDVTLLGPATLAWPTCEEAECGPPGMLAWIESPARVVIRDLHLKGGSSTYTGGAVHNYGTLVLAGTTSITDSRAEDGGGGVYNEGLLVMRGHSRISRNSLLFGTGGGVLNLGTLVMSGAARITGNDGYPSGGGVYNAGTMRMGGRARVAGNSAESGGGVYNAGTLRLSGRARITGNTATTGGGIFSVGEVVFSRHWHGSVSGNSPDDFVAAG
jgi:hypothetical protein